MCVQLRQVTRERRETRGEAHRREDKECQTRMTKEKVTSKQSLNCVCETKDFETLLLFRLEIPNNRQNFIHWHLLFGNYCITYLVRFLFSLICIMSHVVRWAGRALPSVLPARSALRSPLMATASLFARACLPTRTRLYSTASSATDTAEAHGDQMDAQKSMAKRANEQTTSYGSHFHFAVASSGDDAAIPLSTKWVSRAVQQPGMKCLVFRRQSHQKKKVSRCRFAHTQNSRTRVVWRALSDDTRTHAASGLSLLPDAVINPFVLTYESFSFSFFFFHSVCVCVCVGRSQDKRICCGEQPPALPRGRHWGQAPGCSDASIDAAADTRVCWQRGCCEYAPTGDHVQSVWTSATHTDTHARRGLLL